jgi:hypothetical protein
VINVYPDTLAWIHDFTYSFNDPITNMYFWHPSYDEYPVVGVNWKQARAFVSGEPSYLIVISVITANRLFRNSACLPNQNGNMPLVEVLIYHRTLGEVLISVTAAAVSLETLNQCVVIT